MWVDLLGYACLLATTHQMLKALDLRAETPGAGAPLSGRC